MSLSAQVQGQLAVEPAAASVEVADGVALVRAEVELRLSPKPLKGAVTVISNDAAFLIHEVLEVRRFERSLQIEVHGEYIAAEPRAVTLTYSIDGLEATQTVTFAPATASAASIPAAVSNPSPELARGRYVPFEDDEHEYAPAVEPARTSATPFAQRPIASTAATTWPAAELIDWDGVEVPSPAMRLGVSIAEFVVACIAYIVVGTGLLFAAVIPLVSACGSDDYAAGTGCKQVEDVIITSLVVYAFTAIPLYYAVADMIGGGIAYRLLGLRIVCRGAWLLRPVRDNVDRVRPGFLRGLLRTAIGYLGALCFALGHLWIFTNPRRLGWHDLAAGTMVVRVRR
jgi:uncharacterized RDD family membrane protein YckC